MPRITQFREEPYGLFLDYEGFPAGVAVSLKSGDFSIADTPWLPAGSGGCLVGTIGHEEIVNLDCVHQDANSYQLSLRVAGRSNREFTIDLGNTTDVRAALDWRQRVMEVIRPELKSSDIGSIAPVVAHETEHPNFGSM